MNPAGAAAFAKEAVRQPEAAPRPTDEPVAVRLREVVKTYGTGEVQVPALRGISLDLPYHRFSMVVGASGSGKSTLLNLIGCIDAPTQGSVEVCGEKVGALDDDALADFRAKNIGFIFQTFSLIPVLSAYENVEYPLLLLGLAAAERRARTTAMLEAVGLAEHARHRPNQLSGGQKQRVAIARALAGRPRLIMADEPTASLDSDNGKHITLMMRKLAKSHGCSVLTVTHDPRIMEVADRVLHIEDGALRAG